MKGDFSRFTFDPKKNYIGTLMQQGRVQLDADWNEQQAIQRHYHETAIAEVIGVTGVPKEGGGFDIAVDPGSALSISKGKIYVDGILCENPQPAPIDKQPFLRGFDAPRQSGRYLVYLDVWERHVTATEDPQIREKALGGVDTTTRVQVVWQVKLTDTPVSNSRCTQFAPGWDPAGLPRGEMSAKTAISSAAEKTCVLPEKAGYRGLENQLYRVEIHRGGPRDAATFKWSRDNGAITTHVTKISGSALTVSDLGRDNVLGFENKQWVEIIDRIGELKNQRGHLLQIESIDRSKKEIKFSTPLPPIPTNANGAPDELLMLRRWDNDPGNTSATEVGIPLTSAPIALGKDGIEVAFKSGNYKTGDYWLISARTAINSETGNIEWPSEGNQPKFLPPHGVEHHYCPLALVDFDHVTRKFSKVADGDCRKLFPALTAISASDVEFDNSICLLNEAKTIQEAIDNLCKNHRGSCKITPAPGPGWEKIFETLGDGQDACICFPVGEFELNKPLVIKNKGHIILTGAGSGTRISARRSESVLFFENCKSIKIRDINARSGRVEPAPNGETHLSGTLTILDCEDVTVENAVFRCAAGTKKAAACIAVRYAAVESKAFRETDTPAELVAAGEREKQAADAAMKFTVRIRHCDLHAGDQQVGLLVANGGRLQIQDNLIRVVEKQRKFQGMIGDPVYRAKVRKHIMSNIHVTESNQPPPGLNTNAVVRINRFFVHFKTDELLMGSDKTAWDELLDSTDSGNILHRGQAIRFIRKLADEVIGFKRTLPDSAFRSFQEMMKSLEDMDRAAASQGIVVAGRRANEVQIRSNTIEGVLQGIHVGLSHRGAKQGAERDIAGPVFMDGNKIIVRITAASVRDRHGIFVGSTSSLSIENNIMELIRTGGGVGKRISVEGIRVYGHIGRRMIIRQNHIHSFNIGIFMAPFVRDEDAKRYNIWLVSENMMEGAQTQTRLSEAVSKMEARISRQIIRRPYNYS